MEEQDFFINLISDFTEQIVSCSDIYNLDGIIKNICKNNNIISEITLYIHDENLQKLKHFSTPWKSIPQDEQKFLYQKFCLLEQDTFATEDNYFKTDDKDFNENNKYFFFDIFNNYQKVGLIKFQIKYHVNFILRTLITIKNIIALCATNLTISSQMEGNLQFYNTMKNIAKIIESQYEPNYVIPLMGEMIDRFCEQHLIYIFIKNAQGYKLAWPKAFKQQNIIETLNDLTIDNSYFLMNDMQTGIFGLVCENTIIGAIVAYSNIDKLTNTQVDYLVQLSKQAATTLQRAYVYAEILEHATLDALTGLNNRRQFETRLSQEVATAKRQNTDLCCIMTDVDHFKSVNDTYGHLAGDCVLKQVAQLIKNELREYDTACRYGGEEFIIILPFTAMKEAMFVAQRLRKTIEETKIDISEAKIENIKSINITISAGVSCFDSEKDNPQTFYQKADAALYDAKNAGRNRVIAFS